ncbi:hypothetical protein [Pedobacter sp. L105]|uniref:hypothetical protein n=1 Tax=Pedobacter sp. L105 TaxID=1641871 RepID=UPI00131D075F|nr:hypothetical protein [Pedobacter sp. L105]
MNYEIEEKRQITAAIDKIKNQVDTLIDIYEEKEEYEICDILLQYRNVVLPRIMENYIN